ncbi:MAG: hypothetical protein IPL08_04655 [Saprospiraceae bacterium]|nr:hypothetical protein [Saprospiraceae bacterium]
MKNDKLLGEDLIKLQDERGKICISIIVPTHRLSSERQVDTYEVEKSMNMAIQLLEYKYPEKDVKPLVSQLKTLVGDIDYTHNADGLGIYMSPDMSLVVKYPFVVEQKVMVGDNFEIRDLVYKTNISMPYYALMITEKRIRLFEGILDTLTEIKGKHFPLDYHDDYIYNTPSRGSSNTGNSQMKSFEGDKSTLEAVRFKDFFRDADEYLADYMVQNRPIMIAGPEKELSWYESITEFRNHIMGKLQGSYDHMHVGEFGKKIWSLYEASLKAEVDKIILDFEEKIGTGMGVTGIQDIWTSVNEGKGWKLVLEKDYKVPGFLVKGNEQFLMLRPPKEDHITMPDAVDSIIEMVMDKGGQVFFTDRDRLEKYNGIILITRY